MVGNGFGDSVHGDEVLEVNGGDNCMTVGKHLMLWNGTLKRECIFIAVRKQHQ